MSNDSKNKKDSYLGWLSWLLWWQTDKQEIEEQVKQYNELKIYQSMRGISLLFLIFNTILNILFIFFLNVSVGIFFDLAIFLILGFFIYKGHRWAMIVTMILWTYERFFVLTNVTITQNSSLLLGSLFWWATLMHVLFYAYKIEQVRAKWRKEEKTIKIIKPAEGKQNDYLSELERLIELKSKGIITDKDYQLKKKQLLGI